MRLKRIEKEIIKEPFSQSQDDIDADHYHDVGDLIISTDQSYYVEDILYCEGKEDDQRILLPDTVSYIHCFALFPPVLPLIRSRRLIITGF